MSLTTGISCLAVLLLFRSVDWRTYSSSFFGFSFNKGYPRYRCKAIHFVFSSVFGRHEFCKHQHYCKQQSWTGLSCRFSRYPEGISFPSWWVRESLGTPPSERVLWLFLFIMHVFSSLWCSSTTIIENIHCKYCLVTNFTAILGILSWWQDTLLNYSFLPQNSFSDNPGCISSKRMAMKSIIPNTLCGSGFVYITDLIITLPLVFIRILSIITFRIPLLLSAYA